MMPSNRRVFLQSVASTAAALPLASVSHATSANNQVRLGLVGCGVRGRSFVPYVHAVCDPDRERLAVLAKSTNVPEHLAVTDMRRLLDNPELDGVIIATPDHWHAPAAILACKAGKHVYLEKPASHNFRESQLLLEAADEAGVVVQHGTQQRSRPFTRDAIAMLHDGAIGEVHVAKAWNVQQRGSIGTHHPSTPPPSIDYDTWVGPAAWLPYQQNRLHSDWHWWYNFGTGDIGNDGAHELDYARWGLGIHTLPSRVYASGGKYHYQDDQQFPDTATCTFDFNQDDSAKQLIFEMRLWSRNYPHNCDSGVEFYGSEGQMFLSKRGKLVVRGQDNKVTLERRPGEENNYAHVENFLDAIRGNASLNAPLVEAHRSVGLIHLANASLRVKRSIDFNADTETIEKDPEANQLLTRKYRDGGHWGIPSGVA